MKTYVLTLSKVFPSTHARAGQLTDFKTAFNNAILCAKCQEKPKGMCMGECIIGFRKIHTIRANYRLWTKRIVEVQRGEAVLSVRQWSGRPYMSKQETIATLNADDGVGIQLLRFHEDADGISGWQQFDIDGHYNNLINVANNDGLTYLDWRLWFKNYDLSKPLAIIHFTKFRY